MMRSYRESARKDKLEEKVKADIFVLITIKVKPKERESLDYMWQAISSVGVVTDVRSGDCKEFKGLY